MTENKPNKIFCYTGTGNCYASSKQIAKELNMEVIHITHELVESKPHVEGEVCIIVFPVYAFGVPKLVKHFIRATTFKVEHMVVLDTQGSWHGGALAEAIRLLRRRKQRVAYTKGIRAVENFVHMFKLPKEEQIVLITQKQQELTNGVISDIKNRKRNRRLLFRPGSDVISFVFRRVTGMFARRYKFTDDCNGCGICFKVCPPRAIEMTEGMPAILPKRCDHCQACMQLCPQKAIKYGRVKPNGRRYKHADVPLAELIKREN